MMKGQKGITLIALIITIIVMLILVGVSVTVALNGGLFEKAGEARSKTQNELNLERQLDSTNVNIGGSVYTIDNYVNEIVNGKAE